MLDSDSDVLLRLAQVRERYNVSTMWVNRRLADGSGFPQPIRLVNGISKTGQATGHRFWRLADLIAWERARAARVAA